MRKHVIFDMDGVLVDSEPVHMQILAEVLREMGVEITKEYHFTLVGMGALMLWEKLKKDFGLQGDPKDLLEAHKAYFFEVIGDRDIPPTSGISELLDRLRASGYNLSLGSSSPVKLIDIFMDKVNLREYFDYVVSSEHVANGKPFPDIFLKISELYGIAPESFVVIEDSRNGVKAARAAGMQCIGYRNENSGNQDLSAADLLIDDFRELTTAKMDMFYLVNE
ncbi:haloacid dehalogenase superfamily, subfamily IA, variant 3 with third motif having DD or ED/haloacid dehalogenase superfamily, subfamily IA, variant 1 with third motif having Dx(3-4)D or Dx(3-4)E [Sinomicrobium oceani]|uniref:Haloacid dehalogenase superfamily, subfamily IA, variant 3 with third motif having DD or ED/haloacid dehalogenase superfamily, subfamily IA, variant 1 with third motif having Dx(3-4)D or Dx(3-4)E n=1 Tax=Sinomicrobium oceani TaxID=1150368 RepID=A0A1K1PNW3_9FLAO|nr:HAD family phosphatase [Sinomicrobium oceani]SFW49209.1 haloacid dehalogenase superfamily, subfamily IA, variant 3 with third motif having DD or ED/haloacid dehalogenase superfamily, subfamily IA, variant 1 with third motif having Dx(3-4)D or Dx(3-4)E [Sinomicrobium oceani]